MTTSATRATDTTVGVARRVAVVSVTRIAAFAVLVVVAVAIVFPLLYAVLGGFKTNGELVANPGTLLPT